MQRRTLLAAGAASLFGVFVPQHLQAGIFARRKRRAVAQPVPAASACGSCGGHYATCTTCPLSIVSVMCSNPADPGSCIYTYYCQQCCSDGTIRNVPYTTSNGSICTGTPADPNPCGMCNNNGVPVNPLPSACFSSGYRWHSDFCETGFPFYLTGMPQFQQPFTDSGIHRFNCDGKWHTVWWFQFGRGAKAMRTGYEVADTEYAPLACSCQRQQGYCYKLSVDRGRCSLPVYVTLVRPQS